MIDSSGRDMITTAEVKETAAEYRKAETFLNGTRVKADFAIHFTSLGWNMHASQSVVSGWKYADSLQESWYRPAIELGLRPDIIDAAQQLVSYKLIFTPMLMTLEERDLGKRMAEWVKNGGVWVVGPLTDVRDCNGARYCDRYFGLLEELTGAHWEYGIPDRENRIHAEWADGEPFDGKMWFEVCAPSDGMLVKVVNSHKSINNHAILSEYAVGKGRVIVLGTVPSKKDMKRLINIVCTENCIEIPEVKGDVMIARREGEAGSGYVMVEYSDKPATVVLPEPMIEILTQKRLEGKVEMKPYDVLVLKDERV